VTRKAHRNGVSDLIQVVSHVRSRKSGRPGALRHGTGFQYDENSDFTSYLGKENMRVVMVKTDNSSDI